MMKTTWQEVLEPPGRRGSAFSEFRHPLPHSAKYCRFCYLAASLFHRGERLRGQPARNAPSVENATASGMDRASRRPCGPQLIHKLDQSIVHDVAN